MPITEFLKENGFTGFVGNSQQVPGQITDLINLSKSPHIDVMEIGFNAGHSAEIFLNNNPTLKLTSFDLNANRYVNKAKKYIDNTYPDRHRLIIGDSTISVPKYIKDNPNKKFDLIFIDGGHSYEVANADLENCRNLANKTTIVLVDDIICNPKWVRKWNIGPTKTWVEHINKGVISEIDRVEYKPGRGMAWGRYVF